MPADENAPQLSALFVVKFDHRIGYSLAWQRSLTGLKLDGAVEFKSLPSGLHNVTEDLYYFVHEQNIGLAVFKNVTASEQERSASFHVIGALASLDGSRMNKIWLHAQPLRTLFPAARDLDLEALQKLEQYWTTHATKDNSKRPVTAYKAQDQPKRRGRALSEPISLLLESNNPVRSLIPFLDTFGPLAFPLYRALLSRQRILFIKPPPLHTVCNYVYVLSVLASLPRGILDILDADLSSRPDSLFTVGVHDIPDLQRRADATKSTDQDDSKENQEPGLVACSSDELLATKTNLYDLRIELGDTIVGTGIKRKWPTMTTSNGVIIKATQRDLRRYKNLRAKLAQFDHVDYESEPVYTDAERDDDCDHAPLLTRNHTALDQTIDMPDLGETVEPWPWAAIAYDSFVWWASAGERHADLQEEEEFDRVLLRAIANVQDIGAEQPSEQFEMSVVAYFHALTSSIIQHLVELVDATLAVSEQHDSVKPCVFITRDSLVKLGLDVWSKADRDFVTDMVQTYFNCDCDIQAPTVLECCGVRIL